MRVRFRCCHCKYHSLVTYFPWSLVKCEFKAALSGRVLRLQAHFTFMRRKGKKKSSDPLDSLNYVTNLN